ncbi:MAG: MotA/TolQ/ExbB proton channel family protein [bacterium]|nr:MotA/TolQ/ExbB proton channel family protein [bacterium]
MIQSFARFFTGGGPFMWAILLIFAGAMAVIIERLFFYLVSCRNNSAEMVADAAKALNNDDTNGALEAVSGRKAPLNSILTSVIERHGQGMSFREIRQGVEEVAIGEVPRLSQRLNYLAMFANIATLAGLLGTIFGLQRSFSSLAVAAASEKAAMLAAGISQAMNTTAFGLIVAIPCLIAFAKLSNMQAELAEDLDASSMRMLNYIEHKLEVESRDESAQSSRSPQLGRIPSRDNREDTLSAG